jgi:flagellar biosynthesis/type III secretory pathway protein FliH
VTDSISTLRAHVSESPTEARVLSCDLASYAEARREANENRLRKEGFQEATETAAHSLEKAAEMLAGCRGELEASAVMLAVDIAQELLRVELANGNYDITKIVRDVLATHTGITGSTVLRVNPEDAEALSEMRFRSGTEVQGDPAIRRGDIHFETDQGLMVREMDECLNAVRDKLKEATR